MSWQPPPGGSPPGNAPPPGGGGYGPPPQAGYGPPAQAGYGPPPQAGYGPPPGAGYGPPPGWGPQQGYGAPGGAPPYAPPGPNPYASPGGFNPYAPPVHYDAAYGGYGGGWDVAQAPRGTRFVARFIDGLLILAAAVPGFVVLALSADSDKGRNSPDAYLAPIALILLLVFGFLIYQWMGIAKNGQTLGKRWMGIRVVKQDGSPVDFVSGVILREWVPSLISNIPYIGGFFGLVDAVMIFSSDHLCAHDHIAKTRVVMASSQPGA